MNRLVAGPIDQSRVVDAVSDPAATSPPTVSPFDVGVTGVAGTGADVATGEACSSAAMMWSEIDLSRTAVIPQSQE
jgi:hypothetical protein